MYFRHLITFFLVLVLHAPFGLTATKSADLQLTLEDLRSFTEAFARIKSEYVEDVSDKELIENAIRGMLSTLDPHTSYMDKDDYQDLESDTAGYYGGLGLEVKRDPKGIRVIATMNDTPADAAGILGGDLISFVDEIDLRKLEYAQSVRLLRGEPDTDISLRIERTNMDQPIHFQLTRARIVITTIFSELYLESLAYIKINSFQNNTAISVYNQLETLRQSAKNSTIDGLILDLRDNPGGVLSAAVGVADLFLTDGRIVYTEGRIYNSKMNFSANEDDVLKGGPIVILVNGNTASASEIVAGALQDHRRALILGSRTFGKGSVQTIWPLRNGSAMKLTTARYFTPNGRSIQAEGILPDVLVAPIQIDLNEWPIAGAGEANLPYHLPAEETQDVAEPKQNMAQIASTDYQLYEALNLLKGVKILGKYSQ